jgi:hypothetical protein
VISDFFQYTMPGCLGQERVGIEAPPNTKFHIFGRFFSSLGAHNGAVGPRGSPANKMVPLMHCQEIGLLVWTAPAWFGTWPMGVKALGARVTR